MISKLALESSDCKISDSNIRINNEIIIKIILNIYMHDESKI